MATDLVERIESLFSRKLGLDLLDETEIGDKEYGSVSSFPRKLLFSGASKVKESLDFEILGRSFLASDFESPPDPLYEMIKGSPPLYVNAQEVAAVDKMGGSNGYKYLPAPPDMGGTGQFAGTWGMQGGLMMLMLAVCYMLYMILKKRVCSFSIGWKDTDDGGELELGGTRDA